MRHEANDINLYIYIERWILQKTWVNKICEDNISMNFLEQTWNIRCHGSLPGVPKTSTIYFQISAKLRLGLAWITLQVDPGAGKRQLDMIGAWTSQTTRNS